jgi:hypothetical protein
MQQLGTRVPDRRWHALAGAIAVASFASFASFGCATAAHNAPPGDNGNGSSSGGGGSSGGTMLNLGGDGSATFVSPCSPCTDFPASPVLDTGAPANAASLFGSATNGATSGGPCLAEPEVGALFPNNWQRPRFRVAGASGEDLFEIRLHVKGETNDLVVYTKSQTWTMPKDMWKQLAGHIRDVPITVTVRGLDSTASSPTPALGSSGTFTIAPVSADGAMVYWATMAFDNAAMNTQLKGFHVGEDSVISALQTAQVQMKVRATWGSSLKDQTTQVQCIGCHTSTPDGQNAAFTAQWPWPNAMASVAATDAGAAAMTIGQTPSYLSAAAQSNLSPNSNGAYATGDVQKYMLGIQTFSKAHFAAGDRVVVTTQGSSWYRAGPNDTGSATGVVAKLMWFDLETMSTASGTAFGEIVRTGDANSAAAPSWSHDGNNIVYASTDTGAEDGRMGTGASDLVVVPYNDRKGGMVTKVAGASDPSYCEYYPAYSADDSLIAYNRVPSGKSMYIQPAAEVYVIRAAGGTAQRLKANDPVSCLGTTSPGVQNTWPKWSPTSTVYNGKTYHWLIFSSKRAGSTAQLFATAVVDDGTTITTYPSIYLWNQDATLNNEIPAWDVFQIPTAPIQ